MKSYKDFGYRRAKNDNINWVVFYPGGYRIKVPLNDYPGEAAIEAFIDEIIAFVKS